MNEITGSGSYSRFDQFYEHREPSPKAGPEDESLPRFLQFYEPNQLIFSAGDEGDSMYVVQDGSVCIGLPRGDEILAISTVKKGEFFGELALVDRSPRSASALAGAEGAKVLAIDRAHFVYLVSQQPAFALVVLEAMATRLRSHTQSKYATSQEVSA